MADKRIVDFTLRTTPDDNDNILIWSGDATYRIEFITLKSDSQPSFSIGTVTTLSPGSNVTATITGTSASPVLNLGIPKGDPGYVLTDNDKASIAQEVLADLPRLEGVVF